MKLVSKNPPDFLDSLATEEYKRIYPLLREVETAALDEATVVMYCQAYSYWKQAQEECKSGLVISTPKGYNQINPWHSILKQQCELLNKLILQLGFSVAARKKMSIEFSAKKPVGALFS